MENKIDFKSKNPALELDKNYYMLQRDWNEAGDCRYGLTYSASIKELADNLLENIRNFIELDKSRFSANKDHAYEGEEEWYLEFKKFRNQCGSNAISYETLKNYSFNTDKYHFRVELLLQGREGLISVLHEIEDIGRIMPGEEDVFRKFLEDLESGNDYLSRLDTLDTFVENWFCARCSNR